MTSDLPDGITVEWVWAVEATYAADAAVTREPVRVEHISRAAELRAAGVILEVGAYADMSGSLLLLRAASEEEALAIVRDDVYFRTGVWVGFRARPFGRVARTDELPSA